MSQAVLTGGNSLGVDTYQYLLVHVSHTVAIKVNDTRLGLQWTNLAHFSKDLCRKDIDV